MKKTGLLLFFLYMTAVSLRAQRFLEHSPQADIWVKKTLEKMSKKEKIAQLMVLRLSGKVNGKPVFFEEQVTKYIKKYNIGAICLFQGEPYEQATVINRLQALSKIPLMVCIDGEYGVGMRMPDSVAKFPAQLTLGAVNDKTLVYKMGKAMAMQCKRIGIHVNYAPVVDINNNPDNPVINFRSLGEDKYKVASFGVQIMKGMQDNGIMACAKHFPGHGDVAVDSHFDLPVIKKSRQQLDELELYPFRELIKEGIGSVMIAHLSIPAIDSTPNQPTSLSYKTITGVLRNELGFKGIAFTDGLEMSGVTKYYPSGEASAQSLVAGNDMLCLPSDVEGSIKKIGKTIKQGKLTWKDIDAKVKRVLLAKYNLGLTTAPQIVLNSLTKDLNKDIDAIKKEVYEKAITVLRLNNNSFLPLQTGKKIVYVGIGINNGTLIGDLLKKSYNVDQFNFDYKISASGAQAIVDLVKTGGYDAIVLGLHGFAKYPANNFGISKPAIDALTQLQQMPNVINLVFGNPYAAKNFCNAQNLIVCYEDDKLMHDVVFRVLRGDLQPEGTLPVTVCDVFKYGSKITMETTTKTINRFNSIDEIVYNAIENKATPGCVVLVEKDGKIIFNKAYGYLNYDKKEPVTVETVYDLASVTKISATTVSIMKLYEEGKLNLDKTLGDYIPFVKGTDKAGLTIRNLLLHQTGLPVYIPFYRETIDAATGKPKRGFYTTTPTKTHTVQVADKMYLQTAWIDTLYKRILQTKLGPAGKYVYSDNNFILLGKVVEQLSGKHLDEYVSETFYKPLQIKTTGYKPLEHGIPVKQVAPTENEKIFRAQLLRGYVHDPGAAMFGGIAGHAGLFSNAPDLAKLYRMLLNGGELNGVRLLKKETIDLFTAYNSSISRRGLGFDKPEKDNVSRKEPYPSKSVSPSTFGHTGFTGTCVWADPENNLLYIFLSNSVCNDGGGDSSKLLKMNVRSNIHYIIYKS